jgi:WD40 repeat protein
LTKLNDNLFASGGVEKFDNSIKIWNYLKGNQVNQALLGHTASILTMVYLGLDLLVSGSRYAGIGKETIMAWNVSSGTLMHKLSEIRGQDGKCGLVSLGSHNKLIAAGLDGASTYANIKVWNVLEKSLNFSSNDHGGSVSCLAKIDERLFASVGRTDKTLKIWNFY